MSYPRPGNPATAAAATIAVVDGSVWTGVPGDGRADAILISGDRIAFVGTTREVLDRAGDAAVISARGGSILPGFIDSHVHLLAGGYRLSSVKLRDARTPEQFRCRIADFASRLEPGEWVTGGDWDHESWGGELPHRSWIDEATPHNPVFVNRLDGHMALANSAAIGLAALDPERDTAARRVVDIRGGTVVCDDAGMTGVFKDNAMELISAAIPEPSLTARIRALKDAMAYLSRQGVTSVHDMSGERGTYEGLQALRASDSMDTRVYLAEPLMQWRTVAECVKRNGRGDAWFRIGALKAFVDGSLGSHTAAFFEPFSDMPDDCGLLVVDPEELFAEMVLADQAGLQIIVHAIGDRANAILLDLYERLRSDNGDRDRRARVEHAQHLRPSDIPRFAELSIVASMQPYHAIDDGRWAERVVGSARAQHTYAFRSVAESGAVLAFGSDWFVAPPTPLEGLFAAVTRRTLDGRNPGGWIPDQRIGLEDALAAYTRNAAYAEFEDTRKGTIEAGKLADIVVLDSDIFAIDPQALVSTAVRLTVVGGRVVYRRED